MEKRTIQIQKFDPQTEHKFDWICPQCSQPVTNNDTQYNINMQLFADFSYESIRDKELKLHFQSSLRMCGKCFESLKKSLSK